MKSVRVELVQPVPVGGLRRSELLAHGARAAPVEQAAVSDPACDALRVADAARLAHVVARRYSKAEAKHPDGQAVVDNRAMLLHAAGVELAHGAKTAAEPTTAAVATAA